VADGPSAAEILDATIHLHRQKDAAYGNAWKKRGEVIGVMANVARKADRLENVAGGAPDTPDESNLDTAIDLFVYVVKYCAFLADHDSGVDEYLFGVATEGRGHRSDGTAYIEPLLRRYAEAADTSGDVGSVSADVIATFKHLMDCFGSEGFAPLGLRLEHAERLARQSWQLVLAYVSSAPDAAMTFAGTAD
jgi:hypothetical protein